MHLEARGTPSPSFQNHQPKDSQKESGGLCIQESRQISLQWHEPHAKPLGAASATCFEQYASQTLKPVPPFDEMTSKAASAFEAQVA